jgi:hypothetical protein
MLDLPAPVYAYVHTHLLATRAPAYLLAQRDGRLEACGGDLARDGLVGLQQGVEVGSQVDILTGLLSSEDVPLCLPCMVVMERTAEGVFSLLRSVPEWLTGVYPEVVLQQDRIQPGHIFPGLKPFLIDADHYGACRAPSSYNRAPGVRSTLQGRTMLLRCRQCAWGSIRSCVWLCPIESFP